MSKKAKKVYVTVTYVGDLKDYPDDRVDACQTYASDVELVIQENFNVRDAHVTVVVTV